MDLFLLVQKLDAHGTPLQAFTVPNRSAMAHDPTDHGAASPARIRLNTRRSSEESRAERRRQ